MVLNCPAKLLMDSHQAINCARFVWLPMISHISFRAPVRDTPNDLARRGVIMRYSY